jgi:hypothetical protein
MRNTLNVIAESLQGTSRVLSIKGMNEQAMLQESAIQLLGHFILDDVQLMEVAAGGSKEVAEVVSRLGAGGSDGARVLKEVVGAAWHGEDGEHLVHLTRLNDADDWAALPIQLQNYVAEEHMPCHVMLGVEQLKLPGDGRFRHYVLPVFTILAEDGSGGLQSSYAFIQKEHRDQVLKKPEEMAAGAAAALEPYVRLVAQYVVGNIERV